jgi:hypothetical protein
MSLKDWVDVISKFVTMAAVVFGGIWTYNLFIAERQHYPHANVEHNVTHVPLSPCATLVRVGVQITNSGRTKVLSSRAIIWVQRLRPLRPCEDGAPCVKKELLDNFKDATRTSDHFTWPAIGYRKSEAPGLLDLEPNEKEEQDYEFVIPSSIEFVRVYSYYRNDRKISPTGVDIGWRTSSYHNIASELKERAKCKHDMPFG